MDRRWFIAGGVALAAAPLIIPSALAQAPALGPYMGSCVAGGALNKISVVNVWNPPGSGVVFNVTSIELAWTTTAGNFQAMQAANAPAPVYQGFDLNYFYQSIGSNPKPIYRKKSGSLVQAPIVLQTDAWAAPYPTSTIVYEGWKQLMGDMKRYPMDKPVEIEPGSGLLVRSALNYCWTIVNVQGDLTEI